MMHDTMTRDRNTDSTTTAGAERGSSSTLRGTTYSRVFSICTIVLTPARGEGSVGGGTKKTVVQ
jgi:hypothetical protein